MSRMDVLGIAAVVAVVVVALAIVWQIAGWPWAVGLAFVAAVAAFVVAPPGHGGEISEDG